MEQRPLTIRELEEQAIRGSMQRHQGNRTKVAQELGLSLRTLYERLHDYTWGQEYSRRSRNEPTA